MEIVFLPNYTPVKAAPAMQRDQLCSGKDTTSTEAEGKEMGVVRRFIDHPPPCMEIHMLRPSVGFSPNN